MAGAEPSRSSCFWYRKERVQRRTPTFARAYLLSKTNVWIFPRRKKVKPGRPADRGVWGGVGAAGHERV